MFILSAASPAASLAHRPLSAFDANREPWRELDSDQNYLFIGNSPREMALGLPPRARPVLPMRLQSIAQRELDRIRRQLKLSDVEFEVWPGFDDWNSITWMVGRYRESSRHAWKWLDQTFQVSTHRGGSVNAVLPEILDPQKPEDSDQIFNHRPADLYQRPSFETIVWTSADRKEVLGAWLKYGEAEKRMQSLCGDGHCAAISVSPPARFNDEPITFTVRVDRRGVHFPPAIDWVKEVRSRAKAKAVPPLIAEWPAGGEERFALRIKQFSGQVPLRSPFTGEIIDFKKQSSGQPDNQLKDTAGAIYEMAKGIGYQPWRDSSGDDRFVVRLEHFNWEGIPQTQVIATIRGRNRGPAQRVVVFSAHFDKAIAEDTYEKSGGKIRETTPGADDNISGIATLLLGMETLFDRYRDVPPAFDIEFVFDTGEEFPAGTAGARYYVSHDLLAKKRAQAIDFNLDMIGFRTPGDRVFQISPGLNPDSWPIAQAVLGIAEGMNEQIRNVRQRWEPVVLYPWSQKRQFDQTSGCIWDWAGYLSVTGNEHLNLEHRHNPHYHQSDDLAIDLPYALFQARVFIEATARAAEGRF